VVETARRKKAESAAQPNRIAVWDEACKLVLIRTDPARIYTGPIESGVEFFVLMLEQLGAETHYSCRRGTQKAFTSVFKAPLRVAEKIHACGFFSVELEGKGPVEPASLTAGRCQKREEFLFFGGRRKRGKKSWARSSWRVIPKESANNMTTPIPDLYQVKWLQGGWRYGIVARWSPESIAAYTSDQQVIVDDAVTTDRYRVNIADLQPIEMSFDPPDEYREYVDEQHQIAEEHSASMPAGIRKGKLFSVPCGDGYAYYVVTKVNKKTVDIEWRGFSFDRWVDFRFGPGGRENENSSNGWLPEKNLCVSYFRVVDPHDCCNQKGQRRIQRQIMVRDIEADKVFTVKLALKRYDEVMEETVQEKLYWTGKEGGQANIGWCRPVCT
jgi:hypothetical protein